MGLMTVGPPGPPPPPAPPVSPVYTKPNWLKAERPDRNSPEEAKVAAELRQRWYNYQTADAEFLRNARFELDFLDNHWVAEESGRLTNQDLQAIGRAAFHIDLLNPAIDLTVNVARLNKTTVQFIPISDNADKATAEIRSGLYRNIERVSKAAIARETAYQMAVSIGRGYYRVMIEDEDGPTFQKRIGIQRVDNLHSIAMDPTCLDFNCADAMWGSAYDEIYKEEFKAENGDEEPVDIMGLELSDDARQIWFPKDKVRVAEYWRKVWKRREVWRLQDGTECWKEDAPVGAILANDGRPNVKSKMDFVIEWRKMTGTQTLEKRLWPGRFIPIIVVVGREVFRGTKPKINRGMVRPAIDPVRIHDVMFSRMVDEVGLSPLPHFIAYTGQLTPEQKVIVNTINRHPWSVIEITAQEDSEGRALPVSGWVSPSPNTAAVVQAAMLSEQAMDRVLNTYAPNRGQAIADQSGKAIREIKDSGDISHAAFPDNLNRALLHEAVVVNDLMDSVYTDEQAITIVQPDEKTKQVLINREYKDEKTGKMVHHVFGSVKYDVSITPGQPYPSRMAEAGQKLLDLAKMFPPQMAAVLDLIIADLNVPNAEKYQDRLRPPGFKSDDDMPTVPELMQHIQESEKNAQQAEQLIQQLLQKVSELGDEKMLKLAEIMSKERIAATGDRTTLLTAEIKAGQESSHAILVKRLEMALSSLEHDQNLEAQDQQIKADAEQAKMAQQQQQQPQQEAAGTPGVGSGV